MPTNVLDKPHRFLRGRKGTNSARKAAEIWGTSTSTVTNAVGAGILWPQSVIQDDPDDKPAYGFHIDYIKEVLAILPPKSKRGKTEKVFKESMREKFNPINARWRKRYPPDSTDRFLMIVSGRK